MKFSALKLLLSSLFFFVFFGILIKSVHAQANYNQSTSSSPSVVQTNANPYAAPNTEANVPNNLHTYTQNVMIEVMSALTCQLAGVDPSSSTGKCLSVNKATGKIGYADNGGGAIGFMGNMIAVLYTPPAHARDYIQDLAQNFGITKTYARFFPDDDPTLPKPKQVITSSNGPGLQGISPLIHIWEAFRNIAYTLFVLVFVVVGIAIMFRVKIDPRTVMTIQNQIPKIIIGILLVTFSFAIAGFLIDVMWIAIYLFYGVFHSIQGVDVITFSPQNVYGSNPIGAVGGLGGIGGISYNGASAFESIIASLFGNAIGSVIGEIIGGLIGTATIPIPVIGTVIGVVVGKIAGGLIVSPIINTIAGIIAFLVIAIALLWALFRVWFTLLMAYISILINIVFAPFWIIGGLIPGSKISFSGWLRNMLGNLAAFPATLVMFMLGKTFIDVFAVSYKGQFVPPLIGNPGDIKSFGAIIGLGIILTTPNVVKMMRTAFGAPELKFGSVGAAIGVGTGALTAGAKNIFEYRAKTPEMGKKGGMTAVFRNIAR